jgi:hypothetical protein
MYNTERLGPVIINLVLNKVAVPPAKVRGPVLIEGGAGMPPMVKVT